MNIRSIATLGLLTAFGLTAFAAPLAARGPSTPRERAKAVKLVRQLEEDPYGPGARGDRRWLSLWLVEVPDLQVDLCPELLGGTPAERRRLPSEIVAHTLYAGIAFVIENPEKAGARADVHLAGVLGALRMYESMLRERPHVRSPLLDGLLAKRDDGTLDAHVTESMSRCSPPPLR